MSVITMLSHSEHYVAVKAGDTVIREGESNSGKMYVVKSGEFKIEVFGRFTVDIGPGDIFGEMGLLDDSARVATITAATDGQLVEIDRTYFLRLVQETPTFAIEVMKVMADRLRRADRRIADRIAREGVTNP